MNVLRIQDLRICWPGFDLQADFEIQPGERLALVGPSGCGKSTLLKAIAGVLEPEYVAASGIWIGSERVDLLPPEDRGVSLVFQDYALFPALDVLGNVTFALRMRGVGARQRDEQGMEWLGKLGIKRLARSRIETLSGGERQRVAFARALIWKPRAWLLDEPFSALDASMREQARKELLALHAEWSAPLILVTHDLEDARRVSTAELGFEIDPNGVRRVFRKK